ncbi:MAG: hypothetical protein LKF82_01355 [Acinetobacter populi]|jgi:hypothetical protein|uniref:hypothetical protein n=1 Tax=Acinetobacter populi TaxID=1582270 RepID=UPI002352DEE2|nr:hypothetical protein [Acinetobacter populi]MCH4246477.1 hypothetical protein [Acinetobacter populi]
MNSIAHVIPDMQNSGSEESKPFVYYGCPENFFTTDQNADDADAHDVANILLTQALATAKLLIDNGSSIKLGFRFSHSIIIDAISGMETQIEMALKALNHQAQEPKL